MSVPGTTIPAYGIFEGGGVKGAAHAGGIAAAHAAGIRFQGIAGTSAGAVVAALYAAGYREEHDIRTAMVNMPLAAFCDGFKGEPPDTSLPRLMRFLFDRQDNLLAVASHLRNGLLGATRLVLSGENRKLLLDLGNELDQVMPLLRRFVGHWGVYDGNALTAWLDERLREGINHLISSQRSVTLGPRERVLFEHLPDEIDLRIIATRLDRRRSLVVYRRDRHPTMPIAEAVRQSVSIPFFFKPVHHDGAWHIDGGAASNFPAWVFGRPLHEDRDPLPILGFRLIEPIAVADAAAERTIGELAGFVGAAVHALLWAGDELQSRGVSRLHVIELDTQGVSTTNFRLSRAEQDRLFNQGKLSTQVRLHDLTERRQLRRDLTHELQGQLRQICEDVAAALGHPRDRLIDPEGRKVARASVMIPTLDPDFRRIVGTVNFEGDADSNLILPLYSGLTGVAWMRPGGVFWARLNVVRQAHDGGDAAAPDLYAMPPDAQHRVRRQADTMIAIAITAPGSDQPIATLALDTDLPILDGPPEEIERVRQKIEEAIVIGARTLSWTVHRLYSP